MRISKDRGASSESKAHERELLYRAILEMRMEMREMKDQLRALAANIGVVVPRRIAERTDFPQDYSDFVVMRSQDRPSNAADASPSSSPPDDYTGGYQDDYQDDYDDQYSDYDSLIEDVVYEVEGDSDSSSGAPASGASTNDGDDAAAGRPPSPLGKRAPDAPLPTVKEAERALIREALRRFNGNRRKTAEALDISERTLYRKLKDMEDID
jgi:DNA-binding NtrC family response regulator